MSIQNERLRRGVIGLVTLGVVSFGSSAMAQDDTIQILPDIEVFGTTPLLGTGVSRDQVPSNPQTITEEDLDRHPARTLTDLIDRQLGSVAVIDVQNNPYQKDVRYRGFAASPLLGESQGIAVFQNGVRINEAFGDTIQWDLIPEPAIRRMDLVNSNPVFGLNALGGAIAIDMKDGFTFQGAEAEVYGGWWERYGAEVQAGYQGENWAAYIAADRHSDAGWRNNSPSDLARLYTDVGLRGEDFQANLNFTFADTELYGNGPTPIELLKVNRRALFTHPDITDNEIFFVQGDGNYDVSDNASVQGNAYFRRLLRTTLNLDETDAEDCTANAATFGADANLPGAVANGGAVQAANGGGFICTETANELIIDQDGNAIPSFAATYAAKNTSSTQTLSYGGGLQATFENDLMAMENLFVFGGSADFSQTEFHNEQFLVAMTLERAFADTAAPILNIQAYDALGAGGALAAGDATPAKVKNFTRSLGVYATDTLSVTDVLAVTIAARFNHTQTNTTDQFDINAERAGSLEGSHTFSRVNPAVGATYAFPNLGFTAYVGGAQNTRVPTPAELGCADPAAPCRFPNAFVADPPLEQVVATTFEAGLRGRILGLPADLDINWNAGLFTTTNADDIIFVNSGTGTGSGFFKNVGDTRRRGLEAGIRGDWDRLGWFANYSLVDATFETAFTVASANHPLAASLGGGASIPVEQGDDIPGIPDHTFTLGLDYDLFDALTIGGTVSARSGVYLRGDEGNFLGRTNSYTVVNAHATYGIGEAVEVFMRIENLFNTNYETFGVLGETGTNVPIHELPNGIANPRFLSPGQPFAAYIGVRIALN